MKRVLGGCLLLGLAFAALGPSSAEAAHVKPKLTGRGTVQGSLKPGSLLTVKLQVAHTQGWQHIQVIDIDLELRHSTIDQIAFTPTTTSMSILGGAAPSSLGQTTQLRGAYFRINPAQVSLSAQGNQLRLTVPIHLGAAPPPGATLTFDASAVPIAQLGPKTLTKPVGSNNGFSWGTLGLAIAVALFAGGFAGSIFSSRRRPAPRASVYGAVQRRLAEEKAGK